jgi:Protein of unknown function (DUF2974)
MAISQKLFLSILSMGSYNRGFQPGLNLTAYGASATQIGLATLGLASDPDPNGAEALSGFSAQSYLWNGQTIISYRGTENSSDYTKGWSIGAGLASEVTQTDEALAFYKTVTGKEYWQGPAANTILTGHSLGGGLAALVASLSGTQAVVYDYMPFALGEWGHGEWGHNTQFGRAAAVINQGSGRPN